MSIPYPAPQRPYPPPGTPPYGYYPPPRYATFGTILSGAFDVYSKNFGAFFLVYLLLGGVLAAINVLGSLYLTNLITPLIPTDPTVPVDLNALFAALGAIVGISILIWLVSFVVTSIVAGGMSQFAVVRHRDQPAQVSASISAGVRRILPVMAGSLLYGLIVASPLLASFAVILAGIFSLNLGVIGMGILLLILLGILAIFLYLALALFLPAIMMENRGAVDSLGRSWQLTKGYRLSLFGVVLVLVILSALVSFAVGLLTGWATGYLGIALQIAGQTVATALTGSWILIAVAVAYDLIVRTPAAVYAPPPAYPAYPAYPTVPLYPATPPPAAPPPQTPPPGP